MTPTARAYTRIHRDARRRALLLGIRDNGIAALIAGAVFAAFWITAGDFTERAAADRVAAEVMGRW